MIKFPCVCGHLEKIHIKLRNPKHEVECEDCMDKWMNTYFPSPEYFYCTKYRPDNLKYLEQRYEESIKNG